MRFLILLLALIFGAVDATKYDAIERNLATKQDKYCNHCLKRCAKVAKKNPNTTCTCPKKCSAGKE